MLYPIKVEELGERRWSGGFWREGKVGRRNDAYDEGYCGTAGF
jgi:hypothetical protein